MRVLLWFLLCKDKRDVALTVLLEWLVDLVTLDPLSDALSFFI